MNSSVKDLEILKKYLTEEELKDIAKNVAYSVFKESLGKENPYSKANAEFYVKYGAYEAVKEHLTENDLNIKELSNQLKNRVSVVINKLSEYNFRDEFNDLLKNAIEEKKSLINEKVNSLTSDFVNSQSYTGAAHTFSDYIGERFADRLDYLLRKEYEKQDK